jgi:hypothetical protein
MMTELHKLWQLLDASGINVRARYIQSAANVWADRLTRHIDDHDLQLDPVLFAELDSRYRPHSIDLYHTTTEDDPIPPVRRWTPYTFRTTNGSAKTSGAAPRGPYYPTS